MLRNASVRTRLIVGAAIPTLLLLVAAGWQAFGAFQDYQDTNNVEIVADLAVDGRGLLHTLQIERTTSIQYVLSASGNDEERINQTLEQMTAAQGATDAAAEEVLLLGERADIELLSDTTRESLREAEALVIGLGDLREQIAEGQGASLAVYNGYGQLLGTMLEADRDLLNEVANAAIEEDLRALQTVSNVKDATLALTAVRLLDADAGVNPRNRERIESAELSERLTWLEVGDSVLTSAELNQLDEISAPATESGAEVDQMVSDSADVARILQQLEINYVDQAVATSAGVRARAVTTLGVTAALSVVLLALLALLSAIISGVVTPLRQLTAISDRVRSSLKDDIDRIADGEPIEETAFDSEIADDLTSRSDELGDLARAMKSSTNEAVTIAARQAAIRGGVARTIEDVARREQTLVERQLSLLDVLEDAERDPDQLAQLFKLDHLATRMRRNAENLLLLSSGQLPGAHNAPPVSLVDVVRTAAAEIEQYSRVDVRVGVAATVAGYASTPLSHLLAELIENAAQFSPPESRVLVTGYAEQHGITIAVSDEGLGMTEGDLADARRRLASPPLLEVAESRRLGLYVVGLIANRLGLDVDLDVSDSGKGLTATVAIPAVVFIDGVGNVGTPSRAGTRPDPVLPSSLDDSGDALAALSQLLDASPASPPDLPNEVVPVQEVALPIRGPAEARIDVETGGGISLSAASKGRKVDFDPSSIRDLMSGLNGIGEEPSPEHDAGFGKMESAMPVAPPHPALPEPASAQPGPTQPGPAPVRPVAPGQGMPMRQAPGGGHAPSNGHAPSDGYTPSNGQPIVQPSASAPLAELPGRTPGQARPAPGSDLPNRAQPAAPSAPRPPSAATVGFPGPSTPFPEQAPQPTAQEPPTPPPSDSDSKLLRPQRRRRSSSPSWSTPYAPQEQKQ